MGFTAPKALRCYRPIPGDPIIGLIRKGHGLMVHTHYCLAIAKLRSERGNRGDANWGRKPGRVTFRRKHGEATVNVEE